MNEHTAVMKQPKKEKSGWMEYRKHAAYYVLLLPLLAYFAVFCYGPMYGVIISFEDYKLAKGILGSPWVGLKHFRDLFSSYSFWNVLNNTLKLSAMRIFIGFPIPIIFALFLNEIRFLKFKKVVQTVSYLPHFISWVILAGLFKDLLASKGAVNSIITALGGSPIYFLTDPALFRGLILVTGIWQSVGWSSIIYLSAIASVDEEQYEAAYIEGSTRAQNMWYITLPSILPVVSTMFILQMGGWLNGNFDQIYNLMNPVTQKVGDILDTYVYRLGLKDLRYSFSSAVGLFKNVVGLICVLITNYIVRRMSDDKNVLW